MINAGIGFDKIMNLILSHLLLSFEHPSVLLFFLVEKSFKYRVVQSFVTPPFSSNLLRHSMTDESKHYEQLHQSDNITKWQHEQDKRSNYKVSVKLCGAAVII